MTSNAINALKIELRVFIILNELFGLKIIELSKLLFAVGTKRDAPQELNPTAE
jgi:hypothetical protein